MTPKDTPEAQKIAIAEAWGWTRYYDPGFDGVRMWHPPYEDFDQTEVVDVLGLPDYKKLYDEAFEVQARLTHAFAEADTKINNCIKLLNEPTTE